MCAKLISVLMSVLIFFADIFGISVSDKVNFEYLNLPYGEEERQVLDLYIPKNAEGDLGLVLFIHGGWWISQEKDGYLGKIQKFANTERIATAAINYRYLSEETDMQDLLDDIELSLAKIKEKGQEHSININKVMLRGYSAGGHLSLLYAYTRKDTSPIEPVCVFSEAGVADLCDENTYELNDKNFVTQLYSYAIGESFTYENRHTVIEKLQKISPVHCVGANTVPTVISHGAKDNVIPFTSAVNLDEKLSEYGIEHEFNVYPNSDHGLSNDKRSSNIAERLFEKYINLYLR